MPKNFADFLKAIRQESEVTVEGTINGPTAESPGGFLVPSKVMINQRGRLGRFLVRLGLLKPKMKEIDIGIMLTNATSWEVKKHCMSSRLPAQSDSTAKDELGDGE